MFYKWLLTALCAFNAISLSAMEEGNNRDLTNRPSIPDAQNIQKRPLSSTPDENEKEAKKPKIDKNNNDSNSQPLEKKYAKEELKKTDLACYTFNVQYPGTIRIFASRSKLSIDAPAWILEFLPGLQSMAIEGNKDCYTLMPGINIETVEYLIYVLKGIAQRVTEKTMVDPTDLEIISLIHVFPKTTKNLSIKDMRFALESLHAKGIIRPFIIGCMDNAQGKPAIIPVLNRNLEEPIKNDNVEKLKEALKVSNFPQKSIIQTKFSIPLNTQKLPGNGNWFIYATEPSEKSQEFIHITLFNPINSHTYDLTEKLKFEVTESKLDDVIPTIIASKGIDYDIYNIDDKNIVLIDEDCKTIIKITFKDNGTYTETEHTLSDFDKFKPNILFFRPHPFIAEDRESLKSPRIFNLKTLQFIPHLSKEDFDYISKDPQKCFSPDGKYFVKIIKNQNNTCDIYISDLENQDESAIPHKFTFEAPAVNVDFIWTSHKYLISIYSPSHTIQNTLIDLSQSSIKEIIGKNGSFLLPVYANNIQSFIFRNDLNDKSLLGIHKKFTGKELHIYPIRYDQTGNIAYRWASVIYEPLVITLLNGKHNNNGALKAHLHDAATELWTFDNGSLDRYFIFENLMYCIVALQHFSNDPSYVITMNQWYLLNKIFKKDPSEILYLLTEEQEELQHVFIILANSIHLPEMAGIQAYNELKCCMNLYGHDEEVIGQRSDNEFQTNKQFNQILNRLKNLNTLSLLK